MKLELSYFLIALLNILIETRNQNKVRIATSKSLLNEISLTISTGKAPIRSEGIAKVKINLITP
jgi:hypothetical protein